MQTSARIKGAVVLVLFILAASVSFAAWRDDRRGALTVSFLNVGQGDAIFIDAPSGRQVLIDGGPDGSVLRKLSDVMPWWDRSLDVVIATHPDQDHIAGLIDVLERYQVDYIIRSSVEGTTTASSVLNGLVEGDAKRGAHILPALRGEVIELGDGAYLQILSPDRSVPNVDTNVGCVVARLVYGATSFMFSCDAPQAVENYLVYLDGNGLRSNVLKAGHHGSKNSSSPLFVGSVSPEYAVYSRGCDNKYGFPSPETVATFAKFDIPTLDTCEKGTVTFVSDGETVTHI
jgi:competence protein ComEC